MRAYITLRDAVALKKLQIGDSVYYAPKVRKYTVPKDVMKNAPKQTFETEQLEWKFDIIDGNICIVSDMVTSQELILENVKDCYLAVKTLNGIAQKCYGGSKASIGAYCINKSMFAQLSQCNMPTKGKKKYWLADASYEYWEGLHEFYMSWITQNGYVARSKINDINSQQVYESKMGLRVVVFLNPKFTFYQKYKKGENGQRIWILEV